MAASWDLLDQEAESELHKIRLLNVEEKPFKRITKRLNTLSSVASSFVSDNDGSKPQLEQLREDLTLDFAAFDSSIARLQFLHHANGRERERYKADQHRILAECQAVRQNNAELRDQLEAARATLAQRKKFDELAEKITSNRLLRAREEQIANLAKLEEECKQLERERETYGETWRERREQFNRIMEEGMMLRRQIRDEKEEVERREGMDEGDEDETEAEKTGQTPVAPSGNATPAAEGDSQPKPDLDAGTPRPGTSGAHTPSRDTPGPDTLRVSHRGLGSRSRSTSRIRSRDTSPRRKGDDVDMEDGEATPRVTVNPPEEVDVMEVDN